MKFDVYIANRYLRAKRKQAFIGVISLITLLGITFGVAALNIALSIHNGMRDAFMRSLVGETGQLYIVGSRHSGLGFNAGDRERIGEVIGTMPGAEAFSMMREEPGVLFSQSKRMQYATLKGIVPSEHLKADDLLEEMEIGSLADLENRRRPGVVLGFDLARSLGVTVGSELRLVVPRLASPGLSVRTTGLRMKEMKCEVVGVFRTGSSQFDTTDAYLLLDDLLLLLNSTEVSSVLVRFSSLREMDVAKQQLKNDPRLPVHAAVVDFRDLNQKLFQALQLEKIATTSVISLFVLIVALNMISALIMMVMEKHRDIGIMKSFGTPRKTIRRIFIRQGMTLSFWGTLFGTVLGVGVAYVADSTQLIKMDNAVYEVLNYLPFHLVWYEVLLVALGSLVLSYLSTLYPAAQAAKLDPVQALKYD
jgi:lipoprotein-releasing system permease protein